MAFEWRRFLEQNRVDFAEGGANTSRDNVTVHCPFCGGADPSKHMSVNLKGKGWRCWRHPQHRGKSPARLVQALIKCSWERAAQIVGEAVYVPSDFMARVRENINPQTIEVRPGLAEPKEFRRFSDKVSFKPYRGYLERRGFTPADIEVMSQRYGMRYAVDGPYQGRIIFLVRYMGDIVAWTGRTISRNEELRYKALSIDAERAAREGTPPAIGPISHYLLWYDRLQHVDADTIIFCEGPFDALKVDVLGRPHGICATCFFTSAPTEAQIALLHETCPQFNRKVLLLDRGTLALGMRIVSRLGPLGVVTRELAAGLKDPGEFDFDTFRDFRLELRQHAA